MNTATRDLSVVMKWIQWTRFGLLMVINMSCTQEPSGPCAAVLEDCAPLYPPTWSRIYENTIQTRCSVGNSACHREGSANSLRFVDSEQSYDSLLEKAYVIPGDPACSPLMRRLNSADPNEIMPPGAGLAENERCSIQQWITLGANHD